MNSLSRIALALALATLVSACARDRSAPIQGVLLISIDTLRRDHVGLYGYARPTTPRLDELGAQGLVFDDAVSVSSWTLPAHVSMLTSVPPATHGAVDRQHGFNHKVPLLSEVLRQAGFLTRAITSHLFVSGAYGIDTGFDDVDCKTDRKAMDVANRAMEALNGFGRSRFFLFLHFYDPHRPYAPPPRTLRRFEPTAYSGPIDGVAWDQRPDQMAPADLAHLVALYDAEIRFTDAQVGRVLDHLRRIGLAERTLVIVTSDHGEEFGDHGGWEHQYTLYDEVIRVPLLVRGPGVPQRRIGEQASLVDVTPTILDAVGLPPLPHAVGRSLLASLGSRELSGDTEYGRTRRLFLRSGAQGWKVILGVNRATGERRSEQWFDLGRDPRETRQALPPPAVAEALRTRLMNAWAAARQGGPGPQVHLQPESVEKLRALGYVE